MGEREDALLRLASIADSIEGETLADDDALEMIAAELRALATPASPSEAEVESRRMRWLIGCAERVCAPESNEATTQVSTDAIRALRAALTAARGGER